PWVDRQQRVVIPARPELVEPRGEPRKRRLARLLTPKVVVRRGQHLLQVCARDREPHELEPPSGLGTVCAVVIESEPGARLVARVIGVPLVERGLERGEVEATARRSVMREVASVPRIEVDRLLKLAK